MTNLRTSLRAYGALGFALLREDSLFPARARTRGALHFFKGASPPNCTGRTLSRARSLSRHTAHTIAESIFERNIDSPSSGEREARVPILAALPSGGAAYRRATLSSRVRMGFPPQCDARCINYTRILKIRSRQRSRHSRALFPKLLTVVFHRWSYVKRDSSEI